MSTKFLNFLELYSDTPIAVAVSGGVDSMYLMHWCARFLKNAVVLTVNHNLRAAGKSDAEFVVSNAKALGLKSEILEWCGDKPKNGIEEAARIARYDLLINYCHENKIEILLTAHQADDQIETFLMNLARGSGVYGLAGIRDEIIRDGIKIIRPMLDISRAKIEEYCKSNDIKFVHDEMNDDENLMRVRVRKNRHLLENKLGISDNRILTAIHSLNRVRSDFESQIADKIEKIANNDYHFQLSDLINLSTELQLKLLSRLIQTVGKLSYPIRLKSIENLLYNIHTRTDMIMTLGHCSIRRLNEKILIVPQGARISFTKERKNESKTTTKHKIQS